MSVSKALIQKPDAFLAEQAKSLDDMLDQVTLPEGTEEIITSGTAKKLIRDRILGLFRVGEVVSALLNWNDDVDEQIKKAKRDVLLANYFQKNESNADAISNIKNFLSSGSGNTLFNKIIRILDDSPPDIELVRQLSAALNHMVDSDFRLLFEEHKYALAQIEQISPQALAILADARNWPAIRLEVYQATGSKVQSPWLQEFSHAYSGQKGIEDSSMRSRVQYSVNELVTRGVIEAHLKEQKIAHCSITDIGRLIVPYLEKSSSNGFGKS